MTLIEILIDTLKVLLSSAAIWFVIVAGFTAAKSLIKSIRLTLLTRDLFAPAVLLIFLSRSYLLPHL